MKATELRIGNYVYHKDNSLQITNVIDFCVNMEFGKYSGERNNEIDIDEISPIPLTPELLEKCGFEKLELRNGFFFGISIGGGRVFLLKYNPLRTDCFYEHYYGTKVQYLHQLQNLCFALRGEELKITL